jgi:hypothetical protein
MTRFGRLVLFVAPALAIAAGSIAQTPYVPQAQFCSVAGTTSLCPTIPGNIGQDQGLDVLDYPGLIGRTPTSPNTDVQTPFDNLSWQTFVALNWTASKESSPPSVGLQSGGARVWETWAHPDDVFHAASVQANCAKVHKKGEPIFSFASNGKGSEVAQHEEILQASSGDPAIDIDGNWTVYERRLNAVEIAYLQAPGGHKEWNLTTSAGQKAFIAAKQTVAFPDFTATKTTGAIEVKAAWRILDLKKHPNDAKRFYVIHALLAVAPDLVKRAGTPEPICAHADLGLVAMHIIQKNASQQGLKPLWFWSTFEHVDNAPMAANPCNVAAPDNCPYLSTNNVPCPTSAAVATGDYSYFDTTEPNATVNTPPVASVGGKYFWSPNRPFAGMYLTPVGSKKIGTQIARCWGIYETTAALNKQWQNALSQAGSVFANYMLVSTQWGMTYYKEGTPTKSPTDAAPNMLSNTLLETYLQNEYDASNGFNTGSCISCHSVATFRRSSVATDLSFLPGLIQPDLLRRPPMFQPAAHR